MRTFLNTLFFFLVVIVSTSFQANDTIPPISKTPVFVNGEELKYVLHYGVINAGEALITLKTEKYEGKEVFHAITKANTTGLADKFFKVSDIYESYFDAETNLPVKAIRNISEGNYKRYSEDIFNQANNTVINSVSGEHKVPRNILDMVASLFYIRRIDFTNFKKNDIVRVDTYFDDALFPFYIVFKGREKLKTNMGKFNCLKFVPIVEPGRIFNSDDDMTIWLSDDANKIPICIKFDMVVGSFKCDIVSYKNNKYLMNSRLTVK